MIIKKNKNGTFDLQGMTLGKLMAIAGACRDNKEQTKIQKEVHETIENNQDYKNSFDGKHFDKVSS